jgi:tRNA pseudouridine55 synthase
MRRWPATGPTRRPATLRSAILTTLPDAPPCGILLLDKPRGLSSNTALQRVRWLFGRPKAGHTGSLDPLATGMLPVCIGEATKLAGALLAERKAYEFDLRLGEQTDTGDAEGSVTGTAPVPALDRASVEGLLAARLGPQQQVPPMYSALKQGGQPLYKLARQGIEVAREPRLVQLYDMRLLALADGLVRVRVDCSKGTYVRVLAEDLARDLGTLGHLVALRRLYVEPFGQDPMHTLEAIEAAVDRRALLLPADRAVPQLPAARFDEPGVHALRHGQLARPQRIEAEPGVAPGASLRLYGPGGAFLGLGEAQPGGGIQPRRLLA